MAGAVLSTEEREEIRVGCAGGESFALMARALGRSTSTISEEVRKNGGRLRYCAVAADRRAMEQAMPSEVDEVPVEPRTGRSRRGQTGRSRLADDHRHRVGTSWRHQRRQSTTLLTTDRPPQRTRQLTARGCQFPLRY